MITALFGIIIACTWLWLIWKALNVPTEPSERPEPVIYYSNTADAIQCNHARRCLVAAYSEGHLTRANLELLMSMVDEHDAKVGE